MDALSEYIFIFKRQFTSYQILLGIFIKLLLIYMLLLGNVGILIKMLQGLLVIMLLV